MLLNRYAAVPALLCLAAASSQAAPLLSEGFDSVAGLAGAGWVLTNQSTPIGTTGWFQGNTGVFSAHEGADDSYIAANYLNAAESGGSVSNWLITPELSITDPLVTLSLWARSGGGLPGDTIEVLWSSGSSTDVGSFTTLLATSAPGASWGEISLSLNGLAGTSGRFAFRYVVSDTTVAGDYLGLDSLTITQAVPEPSTYAMLALGLAGLALLRRKASR